MKFNNIKNVRNYSKELIKAQIINTEGSVPSEIGNYMVITKQDIFGTIGGGNLEYLVINKSKELLNNKIKKSKILVKVKELVTLN